MIVGVAKSRPHGAWSGAAPRSFVATLVCAAAIYALYFRQPGGKLTDYDAFALRTFAYLYLTLPALLAALFGYALLARLRFWRDPALFVTVAVFACSSSTRSASSRSSSGWRGASCR